MNKKTTFPRMLIITISRILVGGHLLYQGMIKVIDPSWTSKAYLENSHGFFHWLSQQETLIAIINQLNIWGLILVGIALILGVFERIAALAGILLLTLYYLAYPPFNLIQVGLPGELQGWIVNSTLIELLFLVLFLFVPSGKFFGIHRLISMRQADGQEYGDSRIPASESPNSIKRRELIKSLGTIPVLGVFSIPFMQRKLYEETDGITGASLKIFKEEDAREYIRLKNLDLTNDKKVREITQKMPSGMIGDLKVSRMISGSNLISMNMHPRDLDYVVSLATHYNTEDRVLMTMKKMEEQGVNAIVLKDHNFKQFNLKRYWSEWGGKMVWIADPITTEIDKFEKILVDHLELGASAAYIWGGSSDIWYHRGEYDNIVRALEIIKSYKIPAGIGAHRNEPIAFALKENLQPDFFFKTFHKDNYWSAHPRENYEYMEMYEPNSPDHNKYHDNLWCQHPEEMAEMMRNSDIPWIAFKVMAAGAISPKEGFDFALQNGADFICAGMFDFQVDEDIRLFRESYAEAGNRQRPWMG